MQLSPRHAQTRQRGVSLMESLIAVVVLALGLMATLGMQLHTLINTQDSLRRTQAIRLIDDLSERLKLQPDAIGQKSAYFLQWSSKVAKVAVDCAQVECTPDSYAVYEVNRWLASVQSTLPLGAAAVFAVADDPRQLGVMLAWRRNDKDPADASVDLFAPPATGTADVVCPDQRVCHLQYISLTQRCIPVGSSAVYCAGA